MYWFWLISLVGFITAEPITDEEASKFVNNENLKLANALNEFFIASWNYDSNMITENENILEEANKKYDQFKKDQGKRASDIDYSQLKDPKLRRQFEKMIVIGTSALSDVDASEYQKALLAMTKIYSTAKIDVGDKEDLELEPDLTELFASSKDYDELKEAWNKWRNATGAKMRNDYIKYYKLGNKAASLNKLSNKEFKTFDDLWMFVWESPDLKEQVTTLMEELSDFYKKVHAYVRYHLTQKFPTKMPKDGTIPAHLLGNMWAQDWGNLLQTVPEINPHSDVKPIDEIVNAKLKQWTVKKMFDTADEFFQSLGMEPMTEKFWNESIIEKPNDREMVCHASAWDFYTDDDFRIKQCTNLTLSDLQTVHHEMGHIQYFMQHRKQPTVYRDGGNPGFHEAIGDLISLSVVTPGHLKKIGLFEGKEEDLPKINLNYQMKMALEKIAFLPFSFVMDKWRWDVFSKPELEIVLNKRWWELRLEHQGISPPLLRTEKDFDPGAKYHIPANVEYVRYFVSHVLQFQFFESMCKIAQPELTPDNLYTCDFYQNEKAGKALMQLLQAGSSDSWENILEKFIGTKSMSLSGLLNYFTPLKKYLDDFFNDHPEVKPGWEFKVEDYVKFNESEFLEAANERYRYWSNRMSIANWARESNINNETTDDLKKELALYNSWREGIGKLAKTFNFGTDPYMKRQFEKFAVYGTSALSDDDGKNFTGISLRMKEVYSEAKVKIDGEDLALEPGLVDLFATSNDSDKLLDAWIGWRNATGAKYRSDYIEFYKLGNKAASLNSLPDKEFKTFDDLWMFEWETPNLKEQVDNLMEELRPLYEKIHAYVRHKLSKAYPNYKMPEDGTIPAHLLGNMWAQQWGNLLNIFPDMNAVPGIEPIDKVVNQKLKDKNVIEMFKLADKFFQGLTMEPMTEKFWEKSILVKNPNVEMVCHASAWDFFDVNSDDFRIKQCTKKTMHDLVTVHHEMGHVQYYMNYKVQEPIYRRGGNPGFHEAIGDLIALSVATPKHLQGEGLYERPDNVDLANVNLNYQMKMALDKIAFLPFAYVMDKWRWEIFGDPSLEKFINQKWWDLRIKYQGISPPVERTEDDFDPGAKYHIPANVEYVRYFVSHVLQFTFYDQMCKSVGNFTEDNLYTCDFNENVEAGKALKKMLSYGSSKSWPAILKEFTGQEDMSLKSLKKYFNPLTKFLDDYIKREKIVPGWKHRSSSSPAMVSFATVTIVSLIVSLLFL